MAVEKFTDGAVSAWTSLQSGTELNGLVNGNAVQLGVIVANGAQGDMFAEVSVSIPSGAFGTVQAPTLFLYAYPLNEDGTTYGDGRFATSAAGPPPPNYFVGMCGLNPATAVQTGMFRRPDGGPMLIPFENFKFVVHNSSGITLPNSAVIKYKTKNRSVA
jgi:hypothetical protein